MKKNILFSKTISGVFGLALLFGGLFAVTACTEQIDESNFAIKTEPTINDYLSTTDRFSDIQSIFEKVRLADREDASSISSVLSARGNYTVFAPNNKAVKDYVLKLKGTEDLASLNYEELKLIAYSCVIDNKDNSAYETPDFSSSGSFLQSNLNDRLLTYEEDTLTGNYVINGSSVVLASDLTMSNGVIHEVDAVIAPSAELLADILGNADNTKVMTHLLTATGWAAKLIEDRDTEYEEVQRPEVYTQVNLEPFNVAQTRYLGYTIFVETDDVYARDWGIQLKPEMTAEDWNAVLEIIKVKCQEVYGTEDADDLTSEDNAVNRFVAYHLLEGKVAYDRFVHHYNEYGYKYGDAKKPQTKIFPINVWDYYTTLGKYRGLIKVTQLSDKDPEHSIYLNRISVYDDGRDGTYEELSTKSDGIKINSRNGEFDNNAKNGFYYTIDKILLNDKTNRDLLGSERMRFDLTTVLPEMASNNIRGGAYTYFPAGYFKNIMNESSDTKLLYLMTFSAASWRDHQGDEMIFSGLYDFVLRLPPVPKSGTYEIRMGLSNNTLRGMVQIYFGDDPNRLQPAGLPIDMRQSVSNNPAIPWVADVMDEVTDAENDKNMRNQGYLKGPQYITVCNGSGLDPIRALGGASAALRRIVTTETLDQNKTYYMRFKSALKKLDSQFYFDYFEYVPTTVYNGAEPEDIW